MAGAYGIPSIRSSSDPLGAWVLSLLFDLISRAVDDDRADAYASGAELLIGVGIIGALLAAIWGVLDYRTIPRGTPAFRTATLHLVLNDVTSCCSPCRGSSAAATTTRPRAPDSSCVRRALALLGASGWLGGKLAYRFGVRVVDEATQAECTTAVRHPTANEQHGEAAETLAEQIGGVANDLGLSLGVSESLTGGLVVQALPRRATRANGCRVGSSPTRGKSNATSSGSTRQGRVRAGAVAMASGARTVLVLTWPSRSPALADLTIRTASLPGRSGSRWTTEHDPAPYSTASRATLRDLRPSAARGAPGAGDRWWTSDIRSSDRCLIGGRRTSFACLPEVAGVRHRRLGCPIRPAGRTRHHSPCMSPRSHRSSLVLLHGLAAALVQLAPARPRGSRSAADHARPARLRLVRRAGSWL